MEGEVAADTSIVTRAGTRGSWRRPSRSPSVARRRGGIDPRWSRASTRPRTRLVRLLPRGCVRGRRAARRPVRGHLRGRGCPLSRAASRDVRRRRHENMFGDILSDLGAGTVGGLGLAPSADVGDAHGLFQAAHGSAPDIAGKGIANPVATILSAGMMLDWLGRRADDEAAQRASGWIEDAVAAALRDGSGLTGDLGGTASTAEAGEAVLARSKPSQRRHDRRRDPGARRRPRTAERRTRRAGRGVSGAARARADHARDDHDHPGARAGAGPGWTRRSRESGSRSTACRSCSKTTSMLPACRRRSAHGSSPTGRRRRTPR